MASNIPALVNPELLVWARETAGLTPEEAANKIKVSLEKLQQWEAGIEHPTMAKARKMADVYKRPLASLYLSEPPEEFAMPHDFRKIDTIYGHEFPSALRFELRRARYRREIALEVFDLLDEEVSPFEAKASLDDDPEELSDKIRLSLNVSTEQQFHWKNRYEAFRIWRDAVESLDILVFHTSNRRGSQIDIGVMKGISISEKLLPVILINSSDLLNSRIFTLMHELAHLHIQNGGVCDLEDYENPSTHEQNVEVFCNRVAGAILVPAKALLAQDIVLIKGNQKNWDDDEIKKLASQFSVSREVILRRLLILGKTTEVFYKEKRRKFLEEYEEYNKPKPSMDSGPPYHKLVMRNNGIAYTKLVLEAYYQDRVTASEACDYLGVKFKQLKLIEEEAMAAV